MEKTDDYVSVMKGVGKLDHLVTVYYTTSQLNNYLATRTYFQFPVVTSRSLYDIIAYYLSTTKVDEPDEADLDQLQSRLGKFIEESFGPFNSYYKGVVKSLLNNRSRGTPLTPLTEYITYLLRLVYERDGPWALSDYFAATVGGIHASEQAKREGYSLFTDLGIVDGLVYCAFTGLPGRIQLIERMTDRAAREYGYFMWVFPNVARFNSSVNIRISNLCYLMSLAKLTQYSITSQAFRSKLRTYVEYGYEHSEPEDYVSGIFGEIAILCSSPPEENDGINFTDYIQYMVKALAHTEEIYGVRVVDLLAEHVLDDRQQKALQLLGDSK